MKPLLLALCLLATSSPLASAQTVTELPQAPAAVLDDLRGQGQLDVVRSWPVDWNGDDAPDLLVQAAFVLGGNAVYLRHRIYLATGSGYASDVELDLTGGVRSVIAIRSGYEVSLYVMQAGDSRCCPSGERLVIIAP